MPRGATHPRLYDNILNYIQTSYTYCPRDTLTGWKEDITRGSSGLEVDRSPNPTKWMHLPSICSLLLPFSFFQNLNLLSSGSEDQKSDTCLTGLHSRSGWGCIPFWTLQEGVHFLAFFSFEGPPPFLGLCPLLPSSKPAS